MINKTIHRFARKLLTDSRGWFLKVIDGNEPGNLFPCEVYITSAKPGESKGGHYHLKTREWFTLIKGAALLTIIDVDTGEKSEITLIDTKPQTINIPARFAHKFHNTGSEDFVLIAYTDRQYDQADTVYYNFDDK
jgi:dTDP-4-dehydrorhamnose 3,5-epimerase-like enzyme